MSTTHVSPDVANALLQGEFYLLTCTMTRQSMNRYFEAYRLMNYFIIPKFLSVLRVACGFVLPLLTTHFVQIASFAWLIPHIVSTLSSLRENDEYSLSQALTRLKDEG